MNSDLQAQIQELRKAVTPLPDEVPEEWLTDDCLWRFLRADAYDMNKAITRLQGTLEWRAKIKPHELSCKSCAEDPQAHYMYQVGFSKAGQPVMYSDISIAQDKSVPGNVDHCIQALERAIANMHIGPDGKLVETYIWVSDFHGFGWSDMDPRMAAGCLQLFSHHYPERMGTFIMIESPYIFNKMYKLLSPYIDPNTAKKLVFAQGPTGKGGGADLRETLSAHMDEELVEWMITEMTENRQKSLRKIKSWNTACAQRDGVFSEGSTHDCRGPPSFVNSTASLIAAGMTNKTSTPLTGEEYSGKHESSTAAAPAAAISGN